MTHESNMRQLKILHVSMRSDYGDSSRGDSYEYVNFFNSLSMAGHDIQLFDYMQLEKEYGRLAMNERLVEKVHEWQPDLALVSLFTDQISADTIEKINKKTKTLCFFHDDTWRREFVREWAPRFEWFTSSDFACREKYASLGLNHVLHFPFGANEHLYYPLNSELKYGVSFVGQWHPHRAWIIKQLKHAGIDVHVRGFGWPGGVVSQEQMIEIFSQSQINLNLSNCSSWDIRYLSQSIKGIKDTLRSKKIYEQIKGRHFEIPACAGCQLSYYVDGLEQCYKPGQEILLFNGLEDLIDKIKFFLKQDRLCREIGHASYRRTLTDHTYTKRFSDIFSQIGLAD
jgi:spore maturation protein CgeB